MTDMHWTTLVDAEALRDAIEQAAVGTAGLVVVDCRSSLADTAAGEAAYRAAHVPGACYAHLDRDLSGRHSAGAGRHPWPDEAAFAATLARLGIGDSDQVVAYDAGDGAFAARLWFLLKAAGHTRVAVLDGGWARWTALGLPTSDTACTMRTVPARVVRFDRTRLLDADATRAHLARGDLLVDARAGERYRGEIEPIDRHAGHVPGAINRPYADNLSEGRFKPVEQLRLEFVRLLDGRAPSELIAMCGSGITACHHLLAMEHACLSGAGLFTASWSGWIEDSSRAIATGDP